MTPYLADCVKHMAAVVLVAHLFIVVTDFRPRLAKGIVFEIRICNREVIDYRVELAPSVEGW
jgi:hypothetical protein